MAIDPSEMEASPKPAPGEEDGEQAATTRVRSPVRRSNSYLRASIVAEPSRLETLPS